MVAHTPGPWAVVNEPDRPHEPAVMSGEWYVATVHPYAGDGCTADNARLIAAAPELLGALETLDALWAESEAQGVDFTSAIAQARAAIALATGGHR